MSTYTPFLETLYQERATAILRTDDADLAGRAMESAIAGGFRVVEFTLTVPRVYELIEEFAKKSGVTVGAGTVMTRGQAQKAHAAGASFLVSPVVDERIIAEAIDLGLPMIPGTHTPTEMWAAHRAGAPLCKLFPAAAGGPQAVRSILGPMPFLRIVPTNGVTVENAGAYMQAGAFAVGCVRSVFTAEALKSRGFAEIEERAAGLLDALRTAQRPALPGDNSGPQE